MARGRVRRWRGRRARSPVRCRTDPADRPFRARRPGRDRPAATQAGARRPPPQLPTAGPARRHDLPRNPGDDRRPHARRSQRRAHRPPTGVRDQGGGIPQAAEPARGSSSDAARQRTPQPQRAGARDRALSERQRRDESPRTRMRSSRCFLRRSRSPWSIPSWPASRSTSCGRSRCWSSRSTAAGTSGRTARRKDALEDRVLRGAGTSCCGSPTCRCTSSERWCAAR